MIDWTLNGVYPDNFDQLVYSFYGRRGVTPNGYSPYPSGTIRVEKASVVTPGTCNMVCYAVNTFGYQWETSRNGTSWTKMEETTNELSEYYQHKEGVGGDHYYRCICKGYLGEFTTDPVKIMVSYHLPEITIEADKTIVTAPDTIKITATSIYATSYQWQKDGVDIPGETSENLEVSFAYGEGGTYEYTCKATGLGGTVISSPISVIVSEPMPIISISPESATIKQGETATLTATATYTDSFEWFKKVGDLWEKIGEGPEYTTEPQPEPATDSYHCMATGKGGSVVSNEATVTTEAIEPTVSISADKTEVMEGELVILTATYSPITATLSLQQEMEEGWTEISTEASYAATITNTTKFRYVATNFGVEAISEELTITVKT